MKDMQFSYLKMENAEIQRIYLIMFRKFMETKEKMKIDYTLLQACLKKDV